MNTDLSRLQPYPFQKLSRLFSGAAPPKALEPISLTIGEPRHPTPGFITEQVLSHLHSLSVYPNTRGTASLREAIANWLSTRFALPIGSVDPERQILPVNGTREALFAFAQAVVARQQPQPLVMMPNPFYQIYEGAALLAGAEPYFIPCREENGGLPDFDAVSEAEWQRCQLLYLCSPGNPTGAVIDLDRLQQLIELAQRHDFIIASDECYSEIYFDEGAPPPGLLQAAQGLGLDDYRRCLVFHSLSKRSNAPGLRSGFVAGDAAIIEPFFNYRTYHGCAMPLHHQSASTRAWLDERHVVVNRQLYREKFDAVLQRLDGVLEVQRPAAGFYLWARTPIPDADFALGLYQSQHLSVLPGSYLSREVAGHNPGANRIRMALVAPLDECLDAASRIRQHLNHL
jgi:N-succinyldiaminopimelate aminotransferase